MCKEESSPVTDAGNGNEGYSPVENVDKGTYSRHSIDKEAGLLTCRVCQCVESDKSGDAALAFLGIIPPLQKARKSGREVLNLTRDDSLTANAGREPAIVKFIRPEGEVFISNTDIEMGSCHYEDTLLELGCSCKNDLALVHYSCALKWFVNHGSTICEICGCIAKNMKTSDYNKVISSLKEYEALREMTASGDTNVAQVHFVPGIDPDAVGAIRRKQLSEVVLWFCPHNNNGTNSSTVSLGVSEQHMNAVTDVSHAENPATKWAVESTGILLATGLLTVTLVWLITPHVGKETARSGLHILLGGMCALTIVIFFRFFVLTRIKYGPARYWAILFVFWFLVFGIWASRTHNTHTT